MPCRARTSRRIRSAAAVASASSRGRRQAVGVLELGEHERVDPLGVRRPLDPLRELGPDVPDEVEPHARELAQVAVVGERDARAGEAERVEVRLRHHLALAVGDAAHVGDEARRRELGGQAAQVAVERGQRRHAVDERVLGGDGARVPGHHAEAGEVEERGHHPRAVGLADERAVRLEQHVRQGHRLTEVREDAAHRAIV